ncbi:hypothetical protein Tco_0633933 [Tanacetum coccineum]
MTAFSEDGLSIIATKLGTLLMFDSYTSDMCTQSWGISRYARAMIELRANEELKILAWWCLSCKVFGHVLDVCPKKIVSDVMKNLNDPRQASRGVPQVEVSREEVSNSNPFDALNSIENDDVLGTNGGKSSSGGKGVASSSISTTPVAEGLLNLQYNLREGKFILVDDDGKPLSKVVYTVNVDSDGEVEELPPSIDHAKPASSEASSTVHHLSNFVSYEKFSGSHKAFLAAITFGNEPKNFNQAARDERWKEEMKKEMRALEENDT